MSRSSILSVGSILEAFAMLRTSVVALGLAFAFAPTLAAGASPEHAAGAPVRQVAYRAEEFGALPPGVVYESYSPVAPVAPVVPYYSYRVGGPVYGSVYGYVPGPYYVPGPTVIRQRTMFGPRRVRTVYRYW